ncbi:aldose epimerase family protein [Sphingomonas sp. TREG-RG-20F-R18-01]|uniref:aldose epimerase family protein n=1 Tax=Sphingomonas sp. TREG-RG-20F-R18-01 TaxID=2914982 RepID=UPI001F568B84|nr:aldose epimerase family protein [Sphingomonas sp. TREG-RG-20F-R18-01]
MRKTLVILALSLASSASARSSDAVITLRNDAGMVVRLIPFGATVTQIEVPDRNGQRANILLGFATPAEFHAKNGKVSFGATIGRYAGRIGGARFEIDGKPVMLAADDGPNALHGGGTAKFDTRQWTVRARSTRAVTFTLDSPDGFQGFPGRLQIAVTYRLIAGNALRIDYTARTSKPTALNLTNHAYFNLAGEGNGSIRAQRLQVNATRYVATDGGGIPTGAFPSVVGTALDLRTPHALGPGIDSRVPPMGEHGYNHAWLFDKPLGALAPVARLDDPASGRTLTIETTEPSITVYSGGYIDGQDKGPSGRVMHAFDGVALETEHLSDSPNHPDFPSTLLRPGQVFRSTTIWRFGTRPR